MDFSEIYRFLFETPAGVGALVLTVLVICLLASVVMEFRTRRRFVDRKKADDDWSIFDDDDEEEADSK